MQRQPIPSQPISSAGTYYIPPAPAPAQAVMQRPTPPPVQPVGYVELASGYSGHSVSQPPLAAPYSPYDVYESEALSEPLLPQPGVVFHDAPTTPFSEAYSLQFLPQGLMYRSYLAGEKEPRFSSAWLNESNRGLVWDVTLGGRAGLWRYGTTDGVNPQGIQFDLEGAAMVRLDPEQETDVEATDFRFGFLTTWREGPWAAKGGYYHISSHIGDEFLIRNPGYPRRNYVRDSAIAGLSYDFTEAIRIYGESAYAIGHQGGALPWEFQYGVEYSPLEVSKRGSPYAGINGHTREDENWVTGVNVVGGWQWRGEQSQHRFRVGMQYYHGPALQYSFVGQNETLVGGGLWFDF